MAGQEATSKPRVFENLLHDNGENWSFRDRLRDGAHTHLLGALKDPALIRMNWFTLVDIGPEDISWAEPIGYDVIRRTGRAAVVRADWPPISEAGGLPEETARRVALREWKGKVQMSNSADPNLFHWGAGNMFADAVFAESNEGRVGGGVRSGSNLTVIKGLVLIEQILPRELPDRHPDLHLAA